MDIKKNFKEYCNPIKKTLFTRDPVLIQELRRKGNLSTLLSQNFDTRQVYVNSVNCVLGAFLLKFANMQIKCVSFGCCWIQVQNNTETPTALASK